MDLPLTQGQEVADFTEQSQTDHQTSEPATNRLARREFLRLSAAGAVIGLGHIAETRRQLPLPLLRNRLRTHSSAKLADVNTTNIRAAVELGCQSLSKVFNENDAQVGAPFFWINLRPGVDMSFSDAFSDAQVPGKSLLGLLTAEKAFGVRIDPTVVERYARVAFFSYGGSVPFPLNRNAVDGKLENFFPVNIAHGLHALYALTAFRGSDRAHELAESSIAAVSTYWDPRRGWDRARLEGMLGLKYRDVQPDAPFIAGLAMAIGPLAKYHRATGSRAALELATELKNKVIAQYFLESGEYDPSLLGAHIQNVVYVMTSLAWLATVTRDVSLMARVKAFYDNGLKRIRNNIGWSPEFFESPTRTTGPRGRNADRGEAGNSALILETALLLGNWGYAEAFADVELILRSHLLPSQLRDVSFIAPPGTDWAAAFYFQVAELAVDGGHAVLVAEPFVDVQGALVLAGGLVVVLAVLGEDAELVVAGGHAVLVAEPFVDVEGALVLAGGLVVVLAVLGEDAELVVAGGHAVLVAEPLEDVEGALVLAGGLVVVLAVLGEDAELVVAGGHAVLVAEPFVDVEGALVLAGGLVVVLAVLGEDAKLVVAGGHAVLVAEPFVDVEGALVLAGGLVVVPAVMGEHAEPVVVVGHAGLVAEPFVDVQGALVLAGGLVVIPAVVGENAELVVGDGHAGLVAEPFVDVQGALVLAGGLVVVLADLGEDAELVVAGGHAGLVAEPLVDVEGALVLAGGLVVVPAVLGEDAELVVDAGHAGLVAEPLVDVEGALVLAGGLVVVPAVLGEHAELVVVAGHAGLVAEPLFDVQGALVLAGGLVIVPAVLGEDAEVVVGVAMPAWSPSRSLMSRERWYWRAASS